MAIYQELVDGHGFAGRYNSVKRFVARTRVREPEQFDRLSFLPGEEMQVDYGEGAPARVSGTDRYRRLRISEHAAELLQTLVHQRYKLHRSVVITSNRVVQDWGRYLGDATMATTILDRLMHRCAMLEFEGKSYRLKEAAARLAITSDPAYPPVLPGAVWVAMSGAVWGGHRGRNSPPGTQAMPAYPSVPAASAMAVACKTNRRVPTCAGAGASSLAGAATFAAARFERFSAMTRFHARRARLHLSITTFTVDTLPSNLKGRRAM